MRQQEVLIEGDGGLVLGDDNSIIEEYGGVREAQALIRTEDNQ